MAYQSYCVSSEDGGKVYVTKYGRHEKTKVAELDLFIERSDAESPGDWSSRQCSISRDWTRHTRMDASGVITLRGPCLKGDFLEIVDDLVGNGRGSQTFDLRVKMPGFWGKRLVASSLEQLRAIGEYLPAARPA